MLRYLKLYFNFVRFSFSRAMEFRLDFFFRIGMDILFYAVKLGFFGVLFLHTDLIAGWNLQQITLFVSGHILIDALNMTFFSNNLWWLPVLINRGDLDYYLVRPVSSVFFLMLRDFAANSFINLIIALGIVSWAMSIQENALSATQALTFILFCVFGSILYAFIHFTFMLSVFWTHSGRGFGDAIWSANHFMEIPDRVFQGYTRRILMTILPFCLLTSIPARLALEGLDPKLFLHFFLVFFGFVGSSLLIWKLAVKQYASASS